MNVLTKCEVRSPGMGQDGTFSTFIKALLCPCVHCFVTINEWLYCSWSPSMCLQIGLNCILIHLLHKKLQPKTNACPNLPQFILALSHLTPRYEARWDIFYFYKSVTVSMCTLFCDNEWLAAGLHQYAYKLV